MEVPRSTKNKLSVGGEHSAGKSASRFDFARNLNFWQKYLSQRRAEFKPEAPSNREMAEKRGHRKSASNNFGLSHAVGARPPKAAHVRSITSYNALIAEKPAKPELEVKIVRQTGTSVGRAKKYATLGLNTGKLALGKKLVSSTHKNAARQTKKANAMAVADFFRKPTRNCNGETRRPRQMYENFKSFAGERRPEVSTEELQPRKAKNAARSELVINNNINIQPGGCKENSFSGNIKISIDFYDSKHSNKGRAASKEPSVPNLYEKKPMSGGKLGFFNKKISAQLEEPRAAREAELMGKVRSNCISPSYNCYHKRVGSESGLAAKKLVFNLNIDMQKQGTNKSNRPGRGQTGPTARNEEKKRLELPAKTTLATRRAGKNKLGHRRNVLSLPGSSLSSFLTNLRVPVQLDSQKGISMTPDLSASKTKGGKRSRVRVSASPSKKRMDSYSRISEEDNEDGGAESKNASVRERNTVHRATDSSKSSDMSLQSYVSRSSEEHRAGSAFKELCNSDKTYLFKRNTGLSKQRRLLMAKIREEAKLCEEVPGTGLEYYHIEKLLGEGSYGKVYRATSVLSSASVAIKCYERAKIKSETTCHRIMQEIEILKYTCHPSIIKLYEIFENQKYIFMVIEYVDSGDLLAYLKKHGVFEEADFLPILKQVMRALHYLHCNGILHRDVKLDNILIDSSGCVKVCDFGVSRKMPRSELVHEHIGTPAYLAPEIVANKGYRGFGADVWSLGVMSYIALTGQVPFKGNKIEELHDSILHADVSFDDDCQLSDRMRGAILAMLEKDPKRRASLPDIAERFGYRLDPGERLDTEFANKEKMAAIRALGYTQRQIAETLEKEDINHVYALYRLMEQRSG